MASSTIFKLPKRFPKDQLAVEDLWENSCQAGTDAMKAFTRHKDFSTSLSPVAQIQILTDLRDSMMGGGASGESSTSDDSEDEEESNQSGNAYDSEDEEGSGEFSTADDNQDDSEDEEENNSLKKNKDAKKPSQDAKDPPQDAQEPPQPSINYEDFPDFCHDPGENQAFIDILVKARASSYTIATPRKIEGLTVKTLSTLNPFKDIPTMLLTPLGKKCKAAINTGLKDYVGWQEEMSKPVQDSKKSQCTLNILQKLGQCIKLALLETKDEKYEYYAIAFSPSKQQLDDVYVRSTRGSKADTSKPRTKEAAAKQVASTIGKDRRMGFAALQQLQFFKKANDETKAGIARKWIIMTNDHYRRDLATQHKVLIHEDDIEAIRSPPIGYYTRNTLRKPEFQHLGHFFDKKVKVIGNCILEDEDAADSNKKSSKKATSKKSGSKKATQAYVDPTPNAPLKAKPRKRHHPPTTETSDAKKQKTDTTDSLGAGITTESLIAIGADGRGVHKKAEPEAGSGAKTGIAGDNYLANVESGKKLDEPGGKDSGALADVGQKPGAADGRNLGAIVDVGKKLDEANGKNSGAVADGGEIPGEAGAKKKLFPI